MAISKFKNTQGAGAGKLLISPLHKDDNVSHIICDSLDALQIHARTSWPVPSQDRTQVCRYVCGTNKKTVSNGTNHTWAAKLWEFNDANEYIICQGDQPWLRNQQDGDSFIMEYVVCLVPAITATDLKAVQQCQLYLNATTANLRSLQQFWHSTS
jgi:hypothetical protein